MVCTAAEIVNQLIGKPRNGALTHSEHQPQKANRVGPFVGWGLQRENTFYRKGATAEKA